MKKIRLSVTDLTWFMFCEMYYYFLKLQLPADDELSGKLEEGKKDHSHLFNNYYADASYVASFDSVLQRVLTEESSFSLRELRLVVDTPAYDLVGVIDELCISPGKFIIIDDKGIDSLPPSDFKYDVYRHQVSIYADMFFLKYFPFWTVYIELRKTKVAMSEQEQIFLYEQHTIQQRPFFWEQFAQRIVEYWSGENELTLARTSDKSKCQSCRFQSICSP